MTSPVYRACLVQTLCKLRRYQLVLMVRQMSLVDRLRTIVAELSELSRGNDRSFGKTCKSYPCL